jgi:hypothetical protein
MAKASTAKKKFNPKTYPYPECREQHTWKPYDGTIDDKAQRAYRVQRCRFCGTKRHSVLSTHPDNAGQLVKPSTYVYPDDYQVEGGLDKRDRGLIRFHNFLEEMGEK